MRDILGFDGKRVVVTGAASGMGEAAARLLVDLGAEVYALDVKEISAPVKQAVETDLSKEESIDAAVEAIPGQVDVLFNCAGLPGAPFSLLDTMLVNFVGLRHLTESLIPRIPDGGAIASITSVAGIGYPNNLDNVRSLLGISDFAEARDWCEAHPDVANGYLFSKQCIIVYTKTRAHALLGRQIRVNCISPSPTDTPMLPAFHDQVSKEFIDDHFRAPVGRDSTPEEQAEPLVFLGSDAARFISGQNLFVDFAYTSSVEMGLLPKLL